MTRVHSILGLVMLIIFLIGGTALYLTRGKPPKPPKAPLAQPAKNSVQ